MKYLIYPLLLLLLSSCGYMKGPSTFFSKEMCSCLFVEKQSENYCKDYLDLTFPVWGYEIDRTKKQVYSQGYFHSATAKFKDPRLGCLLNKN